MKELTKNRWKFVILPALIIIVGVVMYCVHQFSDSKDGFNFDVEFLGGIRMQMDLGTEFTNDEVANLIQEKTTDNVSATVQVGQNNHIAVIKTRPVDDSVKEEIVNALKEKYNLDDSALISSTSASASYGQKTQQKTLIFTLLAIACILIYIAIRFEWRSAVMAVIALAINVFVMAAVYVITRIPINTTFIAAMLTVIGYSINNTIVIFDRIRENMKARKKNETIISMVDRSIGETMGRTINSTITTLITIVLIYFLGVSAIKEFALPLIIGILAGAYTSIFIASTFWAVWKDSNMKAKAAAAQERKSNKNKKK
jgi:preprotein translocase SecF subunit